MNYGLPTRPILDMEHTDTNYYLWLVSADFLCHRHILTVNFLDLMVDATCRIDKVNLFQHGSAPSVHIKVNVVENKWPAPRPQSHWTLLWWTWTAEWRENGWKFQGVKNNGFLKTKFSKMNGWKNTHLFFLHQTLQSLCVSFAHVCV